MRSLVSLALAAVAILGIADVASAQYGGYGVQRQRVIVQPFVPQLQLAVPVYQAPQVLAAPVCAPGTCAVQQLAAPVLQQSYAAQVLAAPVVQQYAQAAFAVAPAFAFSPYHGIAQQALFVRQRAFAQPVFVQRQRALVQLNIGRRR